MNRIMENPPSVCTANLPAATDFSKCASPLRLVEHQDGIIVNSEQRPAAIMDPVRPTPAKAPRHKKKKSQVPQAAHVIRGFHTPAASEGGDSDNSASSSPLMTPKNGYPMSRQTSNSSGIGLLKTKLDALALAEGFNKPNLLRQNSMGADSVTSFSSAASTEGELETYEVPLEHDFVSSDLCSKPSPRLQPIEGGLCPPSQPSLLRKMTAKDFAPIKCLGKGAFGTVHLVKHHETGRLFAQKQFRKASLTVHKRLVDQTRTERSILESVNRHPFVVKLYYAFQDHEKLYLILEYAQGGELFFHLALERMLSEEVTAFYVAELVLALHHLHSTVRVVYRDLKPENCLLDAEGHLLLTDFGLSKEAVSPDDDAPCTSFLGTIEYMAPEVINGSAYGMAVDWWSLGAITFDLLTGSPPFSGGNNAKIQQNICKQKLQLPYFLGPDSKDFLIRLLRKEPSKRLGSHMPRDLKTIKSHRFFRRIDWKKLEARDLEPPIRPLITDPELAENFAKEFTDLPIKESLASRSIGSDTTLPRDDDDDVNMSDPFSHLAPDTVDLQGSSTGALSESRPISCPLKNVDRDHILADADNPFGGFSYVASQSLLERDMGFAI